MCLGVYVCAVCVRVCACMCTCVDACAHALHRRWPSISRRTPSTSCPQPETAMSSSLHPPSLSLLPPSSPSLSYLLVLHTSFFLIPPTLTNTINTWFFCPPLRFPSLPPLSVRLVHFLRLPVHHPVTSSSLSSLASIHLLVTTPCQLFSSVMVCSCSVWFFSSL